MEALLVVAESLVKIEPKTEPEDVFEEPESIELDEPITVKSEANTEGNEEVVLERPTMVILEPKKFIKEEIVEKNEDPLEMCDGDILVEPKMKKEPLSPDTARTNEESTSENSINEDGLAEENAETGSSQQQQQQQQQQEGVEIITTVSLPLTGVSTVPQISGRKRKSNASVEESEELSKETKARKYAIDKLYLKSEDLRDEMQLMETTHALKMQILQAEMKIQKATADYYGRKRERLAKLN